VIVIATETMTSFFEHFPLPQGPFHSSAPRYPQGRYSMESGLNATDGQALTQPGEVQATPAVGTVPDSPQQLLAMQEQDADGSATPEKTGRTERTSAKAEEVLALIDKLDTSGGDDLQIALKLVRWLERYHDDTVERLQGEEGADHAQIVAWAIDADRLMRVRILLESIDLD